MTTLRTPYKGLIDRPCLCDAIIKCNFALSILATPTPLVSERIVGRIVALESPTVMAYA